eukprot:scaffold61143_cov48-Phaeocystis_antarctica.AAC.2
MLSTLKAAGSGSPEASPMQLKLIIDHPVVLIVGAVHGGEAEEPTTAQQRTEVERRMRLLEARSGQVHGRGRELRVRNLPNTRGSGGLRAE